MGDTLFTIFLSALLIAPLGIITLVAYLKTDRNETKRIMQRYLKAVEKIERTKYDDFSFDETKDGKQGVIVKVHPEAPFEQSALLRQVRQETEKEAAEKEEADMGDDEKD